MRMQILSYSLLFVVAGSLFLSASRAQSSMYLISGNVSDASGKAVCCVRVCALPPDPLAPNTPIPCGMSNEKGEFVIRFEKAGSYRIITDKSAEGYVPQNLPFYRNPLAPPQTLTVDDANNRQSINILLGPKNGALKGRSLDALTNLPVENVEIILCHAASPNICFNKSAKESSGRFMVWSSHVPFTLRIRAQGYEDWTGMSGADNQALNIAAGTAQELNVYLKRREDSAGKALTEAEKQADVNLPAPVQLAPAEGMVFDYYPRKTRLEWGAVAGAVSYAVEIDYCQGGKANNQTCVNPQPHTVKGNPLTSNIAGTSYEFNFIGATVGRWRVWAVDKEGREGFKSPWRRFVYLQ